jgi:hypothetical protein
VKPARQGLAVERDPGRLDLMVRQLRILEIALPLLLIEEDVLGVVLVDRPLRSAPEIAAMKKLSRAPILSSIFAASTARASRRRATDSKAGVMSANFCTRVRIAAMSVVASGPSAAASPGRRG